MEFVHGSMVIFTVTGALIVICISLVIFYFLFQSIWPSLLGAPAVYGLWEYVDEFSAVIAGLVFLVFQLWWLHKNRERNPAERFLKEEEKRRQTQDIYLPRYFD